MIDCSQLDSGLSIFTSAWILGVMMGAAGVTILWAYYHEKTKDEQDKIEWTSQDST